MTTAICQQLKKKQLGSNYDGSLNVSNEPVRSKIESQQPFVSDEDVRNFLMLAVFGPSR